MNTDKTFPCKLTIEVESTNGTTMSYAFDHILALLETYHFPEGSYSSEFWKIKVIKSEIKEKETNE